ncbi:serine/threonine-protein kinase [Dactylosporangium aurantiacum]|uniref:serine/threonine-protein kinase n=1 Tax=Dactylosporangium aurantiacum TaxID=35754 RepID=UPI001FE1A5A6|nr:serine/threonine-protein kinase [Dactylosporangium aurantiacum]MDG6109212.1 serine/threonine-protein kinase [Dactylosporangium aurantiacum]
MRRPVGAGGMSVVWRAWDNTLERTVAVKVLDGPVGTDGGQRERIRREARAAARIEHPNAIGVYDYGETVTPHGRIAAYVVMQLLDGVSLAGRLAEGPLPWQDAVAVAATVADVLHAAHRRGVVHRDVTPENVMLTTDGVKLLDFGIAADVGQRDTLTFGTPPYVAPERLVGAPASGSTDVYALGVLLFEMLTGAPPVRAATWDELERAIAADHRPALAVPGVPPAVAAICLRCLAADPTERPTAAEVAAVLESATERGRRRWVPVLAVILAATVLAGLGYLWRGTVRDDNAAPVPTVSIVVSIPPAVTVQPSPGATPSPTRGRTTSPAATTGAPSPSPSASPARLTPQQAGRAVLAVVDRRFAAGEIRTDVVDDIRNQVNNIMAQPPDAARRVEMLRKQLIDRERERSISAGAYDEIDAAVVVLGASLA